MSWVKGQYAYIKPLVRSPLTGEYVVMPMAQLPKDSLHLKGSISRMEEGHHSHHCNLLALQEPQLQCTHPTEGRDEGFSQNCDEWEEAHKGQSQQKGQEAD